MWSVAVDWLSCTMHLDQRENSHVLSLLACREPMDAATPRFGYTDAFKTSKGAVIYSSPNNPRMGVHAIIPGSALSSYSSVGITAENIILAVQHDRGKVTRLDLAKDAQDESFNLVQFSETVSAGHYTGTAQKCATIASSDGGRTVYIGSRSSERFIRVYDKGIESGIGGDWIRAEVETKGDSANIIAKMLVDGQHNMNDVFASVASRICQCVDLSWTRLMRSDAKVALPKIEKTTDREKWIADQVTPAIVNFAIDNPTSEAIKRLYSMLSELLD